MKRPCPSVRNPAAVGQLWSVGTRQEQGAARRARSEAASDRGESSQHRNPVTAGVPSPLAPPRQRRRAVKGLSCAVLASAALLATADARGQDRPAGWYVGVELGIAAPADIGIRGTSDDVPTNCDGHFPPLEVDGRTLPLPLDHPECAPGAESWTSRFDTERGASVGLQAGYAWRAFRFEAAYTRRHHGGDRSASTVVGDKEAEFVETAERLDDIKAQAMFANVYYELPFAPAGFTPFVGAGVGLVEARADYGAAYRRNPDARLLLALGRHAAAAGTLSAQDATLADRIPAYQILVGVDRPLGKHLTLGAKVRRVALLDEFRDRAPPDLLRGHAPTVAPGRQAGRQRLCHA